jgi:hypothetical protein
MASAAKKLRQLLRDEGYTEDDDFNNQVFTRDGRSKIVMYAGISANHIVSLMDQVEFEARKERFDPDRTVEVLARQAQHEHDQRVTASYVRREQERIRPQLLGGLAAVLTDEEVARITNRVESDHNHRRRIEQLISNRPD